MKGFATFGMLCGFLVIMAGILIQIMHIVFIGTCMFFVFGLIGLSIKEEIEYADIDDEDGIQKVSQ